MLERRKEKEREKRKERLGVVVHTGNPSTGKVETGRSLRLAGWSV